MPNPDFLPSRDTELLNFSVNFHAKVAGNPSVYNLTPDDAATLGGLVSAYSDALGIAVNPQTRTRSSVGGKNAARAAMVADLRALCRRVQAAPGVTVQQKIDLCLPVHSRTLSPVPPPATAPAVNITDLLPGSPRVGIKIIDNTDYHRRARPVGVAGAEIYSYVGTDFNRSVIPPENLSDWRFEGLATKNTFNISFRQADLGQTAAIAARWVNGKGEAGPMSLPVRTMVAA